MGYDIYGRAPKNKNGEYFRNNVWYWRPLADYVMHVANMVIPPGEKKEWYSNSGQKVSEKTAIKIADILDEELQLGNTTVYAKKYKAEIKNIPDEDCEFCNKTGIHPNSPEKKICNMCNGKGHKRPWVTNYPFEVSNVREFTKFCRESGGFSIS